MKTKEKNISSPEQANYTQLEEVIGCKWSVSVLCTIATGITRPGAIERHIQGISSKVLAERLRKLTAYGLLDKHSFAEVPPRTEYALTHNGEKLVHLISEIQQLDAHIKQAGAET